MNECYSADHTRQAGREPSNAVSPLLLELVLPACVLLLTGYKRCASIRLEGKYARQLLEDSERRVAAQQGIVDQLKAGGEKASRAEEAILSMMKDALQKLRQQFREGSDRA